MECHEPPGIVAGSTQPLAVGTTFTVEPGIYLPGEVGVRIEDDMVVTEQGGRSLTTFERDLLVLPL
jgi:Xaa-Pro aminopeptidase